MENEPALPPAGPTVTPYLAQPPYPQPPYPQPPYPQRLYPQPLYPQPPYPPPHYASPPPPFWPPPATQPKARRSGGLIAAVVVFALVLVACVGTAGYGVIRPLRADSPTAGHGVRDTTPRRPGLTLPSQDASAPAVDGATSGPQASPYPVAAIDDLGKVCEDQYFPQSPKYAGKGLHPLAIMIKGRLDMQSRINTPVYTPGFSGKTARDKAWNTYFVPKTVQLVACVDLVGSGRKLSPARSTTPSRQLPLKTGYYSSRSTRPRRTGACSPNGSPATTARAPR